ISLVSAGRTACSWNYCVTCPRSLCRSSPASKAAALLKLIRILQGAVSPRTLALHVSALYFLRRSTSLTVSRSDDLATARTVSVRALPPPSCRAPGKPVRANGGEWDCWDPSPGPAAARAPPARSRLFSPGLSPSGYTAPSTWHPARRTVAVAFPPRRTSANACTHPPVCNTLQRLRDSAPIPSEIAQWLPAVAIYRDKSPPAANAPAGAWDRPPPPSSHTRPPPARHPVAAASVR